MLQVESSLNHRADAKPQPQVWSSQSSQISLDGKSELTEEYFLINYTISSGSTQTNTRALIDTEGSGYAFIDQVFAQFLNLTLIPLITSHALHIFNDRESASDWVTHYVLLDLLTGNHVSHNTLCYVTQLHADSLVLSLLWLWDHKVTINCKKNCLIFDFNHCHQRCMFAKTVILCILRTILEHSDLEPSLNICMINAALIIRLAHCRNHELFVTSIKDIEKALALWEAVNVLAKLPREHHEFTILFSQKKSNKLPSHRPYDHTIPLLSDKELSKGLLYNMSRDELLVLQKYLKEHLFKSFIQVSSSLAASSVIFVKKPEGDLQLCVNYCDLNNLTVKNHYPLPLIWETLNLMAFSVIFTKLDIIAAFNKLWMAEGEEWKTTMRICYELFKYLVMPFDLCEASSSFQSYINDILWDCLNIFTTVYIDDILIYSKSVKEH